MSAAAPSLRRLQQTFRDVGINDDVQIANHVAFLLLTRDHLVELRAQGSYHLLRRLPDLHETLQREFPGLQIPDPPPTRRMDEGILAQVIGLLDQAIQQSPYGRTPGVFFQREVRFELLKGTSGAQYPTPHHIANFMATIGVTGTFADVIDLATGSGGLLAAAHELMRPANSTDVTGCEYDASWASLAAANILLHDRSRGATLISGSGIGFRDSRGAPYSTVLMNPPFSGSRPVGEVWDAIKTTDYGVAAVNVLIAKALTILRTGGRAVVLAPSGLLFGSGANARLRARLAKERLEAIITLDKECFQPFSHVNAHVIALQKLTDADVPSVTPVWMCMVMRDGYPTGAGRDLTADLNPAVNELPRVRELVLRSRDAAWPNVLASAADKAQLEAILFRPTDGLNGAALRHRANSSGEVNWEVASIASGGVVTIARGGSAPHGLFHLPYRSSADETAVLEAAEASEQRHWREIFLADTWHDQLPRTWEGTSESIKLEVTGEQDRRTLKLRSGVGSSNPTTIEFCTDNTVSSAVAYLLSDDGYPFSPFLYLQGNTQIMEEKYGDRFQASSIMDARGVRCGWLLALSEATGNSAGSNDQEVGSRAGWLLIVQPTIRSRFISTADSHWGILLRSTSGKELQGWLHGDAIDARRIQIEFGKSLALRGDIAIEGFAIGPAAEPDSSGDAVFAALVPHAHLVPRDAEPRTFQPDAYLPESPKPPVSHPSDVIARIRKKQAQMGLRVDSLLQMLGSTASAITASEPQTPPYLHDHLLDARQRQIWEVIKGINQTDGRPQFFTMAGLRSACEAQSIAISDTQMVQTLALFLRLGLLLEVHTAGGNGYRRVNVADIVIQETSANP